MAMSLVKKSKNPMYSVCDKVLKNARLLGANGSALR
jgi:hypothetical protein